MNQKKTPIRTTYTYYAPLPNPLQFEYLTNNFIATDAPGNILQKLPARGKAKLRFEIDASTEYSYYWIRNAGHDVDYNDPSLAEEGIDKLGDGVFGYLIYDIPKGFSDYHIDLPKLADGSFDINSIVSVNGQPYKKWIDNPNTKDSITIWEDHFRYHIHIPQLLIPPALCDKNHDGIDDWKDDLGDRFHSNTGYLHDAFMLGNGESYPTGTPHVYPHNDEGMAGLVNEGWSSGEDNTYGSDAFDNLGKVHFTIHADYEGRGKEGPVDISKGGWLVVEEIFGGSPWVIFSHTLSAYAEGVHDTIISTSSPSVVKYGIDTCYIKHTITDLNEPHEFNGQFDPYHVSYGYGDVTISTYAGGKDPCSLISPARAFPAIVDPDVDHQTLTLVPLADPANPDLTSYPKTVSGTFIEAMITVVNGTDDNWVNTSITPIVPASAGNTHVVMQYVAYPRPLVPAVADPATGNVLHSGDQIGSFTTGWRFNQPDHEVIIKMGDTLNLMQPTRRAYFLVLISIDESLPKGVYDIGFKINGKKVDYKGNVHGPVSYKVPDLKFSVTEKNGGIEFQKLIIGQSALTDIRVKTTPEFKALQNVKWSLNDVNYTDFSTMTNSLPSVYTPGNNMEIIDMSGFKKFPDVDTTSLYILEQGEVNTYGTSEQSNVLIATNEQLNYSYYGNKYQEHSGNIYVSPIGPKIFVTKKIHSINGKPLSDKDSVITCTGGIKDIAVLVSINNNGSDIAINTFLDIQHSTPFNIITDSLPAFCTYSNPFVHADLGTFIPGERKDFYLHFNINDNTCDSVYHTSDIINKTDIDYNGQLSAKHYKCIDKSGLPLAAYDLGMIEILSDRNEIEQNGELSITINAVNGSLPVTGAWLRAYASTGSDTMKIGEQYYDQINAGEIVSNTYPYTVPESSYKINFFAEIDAENSTGEICENNNLKTLEIPVLDGPWISHVRLNPNPFNKITGFYYELSKNITSIYIDVFTEEGKSIAHISDCPVGTGPHTVNWEPERLSNGTYIYRITGIDDEGKIHEYADKLMKF